MQDRGDQAINTLIDGKLVDFKKDVIALIAKEITAGFRTLAQAERAPSPPQLPPQRSRQVQPLLGQQPLPPRGPHPDDQYTNQDGRRDDGFRVQSSHGSLVTEKKRKKREK